MRLKSSRVASLVLSGVIAVTGVAGVGRPIAKAEAAPAAATASTSEKIKQPSQNTHSQPALPKASPEPKEPNPKIKKSSTTPEPIEPFIRADAVALGQWLMIKSVKSLVAKPATATKPATAANQPNQLLQRPAARQPPRLRLVLQHNRPNRQRLKSTSVRCHQNHLTMRPLTAIRKCVLP